eukprot:1153994-Pelagomonas_calceolata.AAC.2
MSSWKPGSLTLKSPRSASFAQYSRAISRLLVLLLMKLGCRRCCGCCCCCCVVGCCCAMLDCGTMLDCGALPLAANDEAAGCILRVPQLNGLVEWGVGGDCEG